MGFQSRFTFADGDVAWTAPGILALVFGYFMFRSRIRGVYLSIVTQALTYAATLFFFQNAAGLRRQQRPHRFQAASSAPHCTTPETRKEALYLASTISALRGTYLLCRFVVTSRLGRVVTAVRDAELQEPLLRLPIRPNYKLFIWTLSAVLCALAGALYVPQVGIINPSEMQPSNSIEMAIWVAVAAEGRCWAPDGAGWSTAADCLTAAFPSAWLYVLGALFVGGHAVSCPTASSG